MTPEEKLEKLIRCIAETREEEIDSEAWDLQFSRVAEMAANGEDIAAVLPAIQQYLNNSPDCCEEFNVLVSILKAEKEGELDLDD